MAGSRQRQIWGLYDAACARPPGDREAFLAEACESDDDLRAAVEALLNQESRDRAAIPSSGPTLESPLQKGQRLGAFEIRGLLGAGGMGAVHRAYDTRLGRDVALKVLPHAFTNDPDRLARFEREARVLASLNHAHIGSIYGIEDLATASAERIRILILELVEGETLADRIARGPLKFEDATPIALQIADALEAAHDKGVVHRDLKPANIKITPTGKVKVLDFGLATVVGKPGAIEQTDAPTLSGARTHPGMLVGTASYMSPEQARGLAVDRRTDMWAFGCVLFEMLTGRLAFSGATLSDVLAKILERDPDWTLLPSATPDAVHRFLRRALAKDPQRRLRDFGDARLELETSGSTPAHSTARQIRSWWPAAVLVVLALIVGALVSRMAQPAVRDSARLASNFAIPVGPLETVPRNVAISPDGRYVAYLAGPPGNQKTYLRSVGERQSRLLSELPMQAPPPFFSPDSQWVAFFDAGKLKKSPVAGGSAVTLAEAPTPRGGTWGADGSIVFAPISRAGLMWLRDADGGGQPQVLTTPDAGRGETSHRFPAFLPQSRVVLFTADGTSDRTLQAVSLETKRVSTVIAGDVVYARYTPTGHLAYLAGGKLLAVPFDVSTMRATAPPVTLAEDVDSFSFSADGTLVYSEAPTYNIRASTPGWTARDGSFTALPLPADVYQHPRLSADGRTIALNKEMEGHRNLWLYDTVRDTLSMFTVASENDWPVWSADGRQVIYASNRAGTQYDIVSKPADGSGRETTLLSRPLTQIPRAADTAGDTLIFEETYADRPNALWLMPLRSPGTPRPLFEPPMGEMMPTFSPDGRWVSYVSPHTGRDEVYVRASTGEGRTWPISSDGGVEPVWSFSGRELFYRVDDRMMVVDVVESPTLSFGKPRVLFEGSFMFGTTEGQQFDVSRDGLRFLMLKPERPPAATPLNVVVNWFDDLRRRVPGAR